MSDRGIRPLVAEYRLLLRAIEHYESHLETLSELEDDEDQQVEIDQDLQVMEGIKRSLILGAKSDFGIEID